MAMDTSRLWQLNCPDGFIYEESESRVVAFGIDFTPPAANGATPSGSKSQQAEKDATFMASAVRDKLIGCDDKSNQVQVYTVSSDYDKCTAAGMEKVFNEELKQVGENGVFIFMFVGSATSLSGSYSLNPVDFDASNASTYVTAEVMIKWLSKLPSLPKYVMFIFSCPFANKLAEGITDATKCQSFGGQVSICSLGVTPGTDASSGLVVDTLDHSFFAFFFDHFLRNAPGKSQPGNFLLKDCLTKVSQCCEALSSLVVTYRNGELKSNIMEIVTAYLKVDQPTGRVEIDSSDVGRFDFLTKHVDRKKGRVFLHPKVDAFLEYSGEYDTGALWTLNSNGVLANSNILLTSFCVMMFSVASFQAAEDKKSIEKPSLFVQAFLRVASTIETIYKDPKADHAEFYVKMFRGSVGFYLQVLKENKINDKKLQEYLQKVNADIAHIV